MRHTNRLCLVPAMLVLLLAPAQEPKPLEELYFAVELQGTLVGYRKTTVSPEEQLTKVVLKLTALGQDFDVEVNQKRTLDRTTGKTLTLDIDVTRGGQELGYSLVFEKNRVRYTPQVGGAPRTVELSPEVIMDDDLGLPYLLRDFGPGDGTEEARSKRYKVLDVTLGEIHETTFTSKGTDSLVLLGKKHDCLVFKSMDHESGLKATSWIDAHSARILRSELSNGMTATLTDASVVDNITRGSLDDSILAKVDVAIADIKAITQMKVEARIRTAGEWVTAASLNVPGQRFEGKVTDNVIDGIFEIEHQRYDGKNSPAFPPDFEGNESLAEYLGPEEMIESDDPVLVDKAFDLTMKAGDSWEAACRLSRWVAEEITYKIPGGSARHTFDTRKGECGSHARLFTALCRAVGIPARLTTGCMYTPFGGGSFGQHAWNEIYMGEAGWIPVDTTAMEVDYIDSGHILLGGKTSFNPVAMKVLDYRAGAFSMDKAPAPLDAVACPPYDVGRDYIYTYNKNGSLLGRETFSVTSVDETEGVSTCSSKVELGVMSTSSEWTLGRDGNPRSYTMAGKAGATEFSIECRFSNGKVVEKLIQGGAPIERTIELPAGAVLVANNCVGLLCVLAAATPEQVGQTRAFRFYHPGQMQVFPGQLAVLKREVVTWAGRKIECRKVTLNLMGTEITLWVDERGRLLRDSEAGGTFVIELQAEEPE